MKTKKKRLVESMRVTYENCLKEYHESEQEVISAQSSDSADPVELPVTDVRTGGGSGTV